MKVLGLLLTIILLAIPSTVPIQAQDDTVPLAVVEPTAVNVRSAPQMYQDVIAHLLQGETVQVIGTDADREWLQIDYGTNWQGWVATHLMNLNVQVESLPITEQPKLPGTVRLEGFTYIRQQLNNCAATALTMGLTYFGGPDDQMIAAEYLRPSDTDISVDIDQMTTYVSEVFPDVRAVWRMGGHWQLIRQLLVAGFPVLIETSVSVPNEEYPWAGHNRLIIGYDGLDMLLYDSFLGSGQGQGYRVPADELDAVWEHMNRNFMVLYPIDRESEVAAVMGPHWVAEQNVALTQRRALAELASHPTNVYANYNLGTTFVAQGNHEDAAQAYDATLLVGGLPIRFHWYQFGMYEAFYNVGRYNEVIWWAETNLESMGQYRGAEEVHYWLGMGYGATGRIQEAIVHMNRAIEINPRFQPAHAALWQLEQEIFEPPV